MIYFKTNSKVIEAIVSLKFDSSSNSQIRFRVGAEFASQTRKHEFLSSEQSSASTEEETKPTKITITDVTSIGIKLTKPFLDSFDFN